MLSARNIENGQIVFDDFRRIAPTDFDRENARTRIDSGTVLLTIVGSIGRSAVVGEHLERFTVQRSVAVLKPSGVLPQYLSYQLQAPTAQAYLRSRAKGTAQKGVYLKDLGELPIRVAPLREQREIVAEIERNLTLLRSGEEHLLRSRANLKLYRTAVLEAACMGRLIPSKKQDRPQAGIPDGWAWVTLGDISSVKGGLTKGKVRDRDAVLRKVPYLRVANVQRGYLDLNEIKEIEATDEEISELMLKRGDILFAEGGDRDKLGRGWIWSEEIPLCIHQNHIFRARLMTEEALPKYVSWYANTIGSKYFFAKGKQTTNLASINLSILKLLPIALPPIDEQVRVVAEIDRRLSFTEEIETELEKLQLRAAVLRGVILRAAFEGRLAPQHLADEPASILLDRIRQGRASVAENQPNRRGRRPTAKTEIPRSYRAAR